MIIISFRFRGLNIVFVNHLICPVFFRHGFLYDEIGQRIKIQNHGILFNQICQQSGKAAPFIYQMF